MLSNRMGPQFESTGATVQQLPPLTPIRARNMSGGSTTSLQNNADNVVPFHNLISQLGDITNSAVLNSALLALQQQQPQPSHHPRLDRSVSEPNAQNQQKLHPSQGKNVINPSRYKTEVCRPFSENGFCKYGDKCQFAHGENEIRGLPRHPKYKTELCRTFHTIGFCPYGPRCHFIHSEDEYKLVEISQMKQSQAAQQAAKEMVQQAAQLQAQQQALQTQLKALVSQFHQNQITTQFVTQNLSQPVSCDQRPKLMQSISVQPLLRDNLGSAGDTPPDSMSGSPPILSPVFKDDVSDILTPDSFSNMSGFVTPPVSSDLNSSFNFPGEMSPLQMSSPIKQQPPMTPAGAQQLDPVSVANLAATLQGMSLNTNKDNNQAVFSPPSSPDYSSDGASDAHYRLPVFSRLASQS